MQTTTFETEFSRWRRHRKLSQFALSLEANVSQKHISYLETGRSKPSREMIIRLCDALMVPFRERNHLLALAGYSQMYQERKLDTPKMKPLFDAINRMLTVHNPLPAIVVDRYWNVVMQNDAASAWFNALLQAMDADSWLPKADKLNIALVSLHPQGMRRFVTNWEQVLPAFVTRLRQEMNASGDASLRNQLNQHIELADVEALCTDANDRPVDEDGLTPVVPLNMKLGELELSLFSIISTIGTPQDITADELRVESFYPADSITAAYFASQKKE